MWQELKNFGNQEWRNYSSKKNQTTKKKTYVEHNTFGVVPLTIVITYVFFDKKLCFNLTDDHKKPPSIFFVKKMCLIEPVANSVIIL